MKVSRISSDGRYYSSDIQDIVLEPQKTVYLELEPTDSTQELFSSLTLSRAELYIPARYNEGKHTMKFNLKKGKAELLDTSVYKKYSGKGK
jgi:hypothetical protein